MRHFKICLLSALFLACISLPTLSYAEVIAARDTVTGTVLGRDRMPLPGAKVEIVGQPYSAFTDIDGRFNIKCDRGAKKVRVSYPKVRDVKKKISPNMTVRIGRTWKQAPENYQWFVGANIGFGIIETDFYHPNIPNQPYYYDGDYSERFHSPSISVMAGRVKTLGWYVKAFMNPPTKGLDYAYEKASSTGAILGGLFRLGCPLHVYLGGGVSYINLSESPSPYYSFKKLAWQIDMGLLFRIRDNYGINWSMNIGMTKGGQLTSGTVSSLGFLYFFNH